MNSTGSRRGTIVRQLRGNVEDARQAELGKGSVFVHLSAALKCVQGGIGFVSKLLDEAAAAFEQKRPPSSFIAFSLDAPLDENSSHATTPVRPSVRPSVRICPCCSSFCLRLLPAQIVGFLDDDPGPRDLRCTLPDICFLHWEPLLHFTSEPVLLRT
ncbi:hypothetical protein FA95DRAFT_174510 [Auriscalpium vulgare]|uniref:Uncharacterized protein n=1 Tax=Auriscalpium vulgare TaxID=40419 RepID=A0ACB8RM70_9AGAM|nr:hypothetical protein FA95DRAFT_174510 [Auriscalpium vulgare]